MAAIDAARASDRVELHHRVPRCLLSSFDRAREGGLDAEGLQAWLDWEEEAFRYGVDPDVPREGLAALIEASAEPVMRHKHRAGHSSAAGDFARWGRRGSLSTLARYGRGWFALLAEKRWGRSPLRSSRRRSRRW